MYFYLYIHLNSSQEPAYTSIGFDLKRVNFRCGVAFTLRDSEYFAVKDFDFASNGSVRRFRIFSTCASLPVPVDIKIVQH